MKHVENLHMHGIKQFLICSFILTAVMLIQTTIALSAPAEPLVTDKVISIINRVSPRLESELAARGFRIGSPVFIRIFKLPGTLEIWMEDNEKYRLFKSYPICSFSGYPGPKRYEGDWQSPEGFYSVTSKLMNPRSSYHLSFNIGYPNEYDKLLNRSGSNIMVHGECSSKGCFAMNNYRMEEIYTLAHAALTNSQQEIPVHLFPFAMTTTNMQKFQSSPWIDFWKNLREGYDAFEQNRRVPEIQVANGRYVFTDTVRLALQETTEKNYSLARSPAKSSR